MLAISPSFAQHAIWNALHANRRRVLQHDIWRIACYMEEKRGVAWCILLSGIACNTLGRLTLGSFLTDPAVGGGPSWAFGASWSVGRLPTCAVAPAGQRAPVGQPALTNVHAKMCGGASWSRVCWLVTCRRLTDDVPGGGQILSDPEKRKLYDQYGEDAVKVAPPSPPPSFPYAHIHTHTRPR